MSPTYVTASGLPRYHAVAQALHWLSAILVLAVLPLAWVATSLPPSAAKGTMFTLHKSVGILIFAVVVLRVVWRMTHPAPPDPQTPRALTAIARVNHWLLYAIFLVMPVSGFLMTAYAGYGTSVFWLFTVPPFAKDETLGRLFNTVHVLGQWAVYLFVLLHIAGTAWHVLIRRDGLHERMLPVQDGRGAA